MAPIDSAASVSFATLSSCEQKQMTTLVVRFNNCHSIVLYSIILGYLNEQSEWAQYDATELMSNISPQARDAFDDILIDVGTADSFLTGGQLLPEVRGLYLLLVVFLGLLCSNVWNCSVSVIARENSLCSEKRPLCSPTYPSTPHMADCLANLNRDNSA